jgi:hypothetical protein
MLPLYNDARSYGHRYNNNRPMMQNILRIAAEEVTISSNNTEEQCPDYFEF